MTKELHHSTVEKQTNRIFYILLFLHLVPLFFGKYFPTQDGPSHLKNAMMLKDMALNPHSIYNQFFYINTAPNPNWLLHIIYAVLLAFLPAFAAEKLFLVAYVLIIPLSFRFLIKQINPQNTFISLLIFPFVYNVAFYYGFFNFCISIAFFFYCIGYWIKYKGLFTVRQQLVFLLLVLLTFFSHPVSFFMEILVLGALFVEACFYEPKGSIIFKRITSLFIGFIPAIGCFFLFLQNNGSEINFPDYALWRYVLDQVQNVSLSYMRNFDLPLCILLTVIVIFFMGYNIVSRIKAKKIYRLDMLFVLFLVFGILMYFAPDDFAGGSFIFMRLVLYSNILVFICISVYSYPPKWASIAGKFFFAYAMLFLVIRSYFFFVATQGLDEYMSIGKNIPQGKTFLPLVVNNVYKMPDGLQRFGEVKIYLHGSSYVSIERNAPCLENYEAAYNYFPLHWQDNQEVATSFPEEGDSLKDSSITAYANETHHWPDYVLLWGEPDSMATKKYLLSEVGKHYMLDAKSEHGYAWLYRKK